KRNVLDSMQSQVEHFILDKIQSGEWEPSSKIPSERELSERLELSRTTVRNAIQSLTERGFFDRRIGQGTFVRPGNAIKFPPSGSTASEAPLRVGVLPAEKGTLGYVICKERSARKPISAEAFYFDVFAGIEEETVRSGRHMLFTYLDEGNAEELAAFRGFLGKVDGVVVEEARERPLLDMLVASGVPAVLLGPTAVHDRLDSVTMDLAGGVRKAVRYLREIGHERIAIVNGPLRLEPARIRFAAWKDEMEASGAGHDERRAESCEGWSAEAGFEAMERLIRRCPDLSAVFCANDLLAVGALSALAKRGSRVPDDVSVMGFDDTELARHSSPPLTSMRIYARDMAKSAVRRVLERIEGGVLPPIRLEYPIDLIVRESCKEVKEGE
ncbi:MAG: GntR family transcriptional regulator, partial [Spirochaetaceae bacterium]|nr:GntR family transcriptional regulator [Spirochaetaceae bacterium]